MESQYLWKGTTMRTTRIWNNQHCSVPCIVKLPAVCSKNMVTYPPTHTFLKRPFLTDFKKYIHHTQRYDISDENFKNSGKHAKTHRVGAQ